MKNTKELNTKKQCDIHVVRFSDKTITLFSLGKGVNKKRYQLMIWQDQSGVCFKYGFDYGNGSCWKTLQPKKRPYYFSIPIFKIN